MSVRAGVQIDHDPLIGKRRVFGNNANGKVIHRYCRCCIRGMIKRP